MNVHPALPASGCWAVKTTMNIKIGIALAALLLLVQMINGYVLNMTKLYTPAFTYWFIA